MAAATLPNSFSFIPRQPSQILRRLLSGYCEPSIFYANGQNDHRNSLPLQPTLDGGCRLVMQESLEEIILTENQFSSKDNAAGIVSGDFLAHRFRGRHGI